jgi:hypothetical protein
MEVETGIQEPRARPTRLNCAWSYAQTEHFVASVLPSRRNLQLRHRNAVWISLAPCSDPTGHPRAATARSCRAVIRAAAGVDYDSIRALVEEAE